MSKTTAISALDAAGRADQIRANWAQHVELVIAGLEAGDWETLGYQSPAAWYKDLTDVGQMPPEVRQRLADAMRGQGWSLRSIADELGVGKDTVARDLAQVSHGETPGRVTGADGKTYPASRPRIVVTEHITETGLVDVVARPVKPETGLVRVPVRPVGLANDPDLGEYPAIDHLHLAADHVSSAIDEVRTGNPGATPQEMRKLITEIRGLLDLSEAVS
jgi:hypothetical protein